MRPDARGICLLRQTASGAQSVTSPSKIERFREFEADLSALFFPKTTQEEKMVTINGEQKDIAGHNLYQYLKEEGFHLKAVVVERNLEILQKDSLDQIVIQDGDSIEVLHFMGGGSLGN